MRKRKYALIVFFIILTAAILIFMFYNERNKNIISIGVPSLTDEFFAYDILEADLEKKFNIDINFVDLNKGNYGYEGYLSNMEEALNNNTVDMLIGPPSYQLEKLINNNKLLDITDNISNIENLHKGVVDRSIKMGSGRMYYMSPVFYNDYLLFQNDSVFQQLGIESLPLYITWDELLVQLDQINKAIKHQNKDYYPLALAVKNSNEYRLFIANDFLMQAFGLNDKLLDGDKLTPKTIDFYKTYSEIVAKYGNGYENLGNGEYPKNWIFTQGKFALMLGETFDAELFFNTSFNEKYNKDSPFNINVAFPSRVSFVTYDNTKTQNFRDSSISINKNTQSKELCIDIMNYLLGKESVLKIIERRSESCHFAYSILTYPSYYDENTISELNKCYKGKFDVSVLYDVEYGSVMYQGIDVNSFTNAMNTAFTEVYEKRMSQDLDNVIEESVENAEIHLNSSNVLKSKEDELVSILTAFENIDEASVELLTIDGKNIANIVLTQNATFSKSEADDLAQFITKCVSNLNKEDIRIVDKNGTTIYP